jgi:hypothetical protein
VCMRYINLSLMVNRSARRKITFVCLCQRKCHLLRRRIVSQSFEFFSDALYLFLRNYIKVAFYTY